jgi:hypothetical protein
VNIVYVGNFRHPWCTEVHIARELEGLGHHVYRAQEPAHQPGDFSGYEALRFEVERIAFEEPGADLVLFTRTWGLPPEATALWRLLEARGIRTASYHLDLYVGLKREAGIESDPFWTTEFVFTPDGDTRSAWFFADRGINHYWSAPAVVSDACYPGNYREEYDYDVVFVGSKNYHREWPWRTELLEGLHQRYGQRFRRFGGDLPEGPIREEALNDLYASAQVVVGDSLVLPGHTHYWSDRYPETLGRGGFLVAPYIEPMPYVGGKHFVHYEPRNIESVFATVDRMLDQPIERAEIAWNGQDFVRAGHTYRHRLAAALDVMGLG